MILSLDLEGTRISGVVMRIPRPGLRAFLDVLPSLFAGVVLFTAAEWGQRLEPDRRVWFSAKCL